MARKIKYRVTVKILKKLGPLLAEEASRESIFPWTRENTAVEVHIAICMPC
jgi:hypothetical protein